ncbi:NAD(P)-binding protein [Leucogyrophana mollusca]|uniref:NAD(P)-binding protein n=1 Tax=Leucogyrophana mollusca TaxID=85980 RepID=A0ACB8B3V2_9AGAM|nr:NAD(P)-binding protein [Leucogyrophana mollusca]
MSSIRKGVAIVTGSGQGIGRTIATRLAADGFDIGLSDVGSNKEKLDALSAELAVKYPGLRLCVEVADVSVEEEVKALIDSVVKQLGSLNVMVANAGINRVAPLVDATLTDWEAIFSVNVRGTFLCYKYAAQQMIAQDQGGRIIGASSLAGKKGHRFLAAYSASKFAVRGLTQSAAIELGRHRITVNAYAPGPIQTAMLELLHEGTAKHSEDKDGIYDKMKRTSAVGYLGNTEDVASLVSYLVSPEAHFVTGQTVAVDGGIFFD